VSSAPSPPTSTCNSSCLSRRLPVCLCLLFYRHLSTVAPPPSSLLSPLHVSSAVVYVYLIYAVIYSFPLVTPSFSSIPLSIPRFRQRATCLHRRLPPSLRLSLTSCLRAVNYSTVYVVCSSTAHCSLRLPPASPTSPLLSTPLSTSSYPSPVAQFEIYLPRV